MAHTLPFVFEARLVAYGYRIHRTLKAFIRLSFVERKGPVDLRIDAFPNRRLTREEKEDFTLQKVQPIYWWEHERLEMGIVGILLKNPVDLDYPHTLSINDSDKRVSASLVRLVRR